MPHSTRTYDIGPGRIIAERYEVLRAHRQGGLSVAFEARDLQAAGALCELQVFPPSLFDGEEEIQEFAEGWQPWKRVQSPHVLAVREIALVGESSLLLVTDMPRGKPLRGLLAGGVRLDAAKVSRLGIEVLDGLAAIHAMGLVHGDVKPATVFVGGDFAAAGSMGAVLVDGGTTPGLWTAKDLGERTALIGTPYYAPIELFGGEKPDVRSDIYSTATMLLEALAGVQPFRGRSFLDVFQAKLVQTPPTLAQLAPGVTAPAALEAAIRVGLEPDRSRRHPSAQAFRAALAAALV